MSDTLKEQEKQHLEIVSEQLAKMLETLLRTKKDEAYLVALANLGMRKRCESFLEEWDRDGPKSVPPPGGHRRASTQETVREHLALLISDSTR